MFPVFENFRKLASEMYKNSGMPYKVMAHYHKLPHKYPSGDRENWATAAWPSTRPSVDYLYKARRIGHEYSTSQKRAREEGERRGTGVWYCRPQAVGAS